VLAAPVTSSVEVPSATLPLPVSDPTAWFASRASRPAGPIDSVLEALSAPAVPARSVPASMVVVPL